MRETSKASLRRSRDFSFVSRYFVGNGIDIGAGEDSLSQYLTRFPKIRSVRSWDKVDGDAQYLNGVPDNSFDFVYSSHCLEHMQDPIMALANWLRVLKPTGHLIVCIPDEDLYEGSQWPSILNADHKWSFTIAKSMEKLPNTLQILDLCRNFDSDIECERISLIRDHWVEGAGLVDQTLGQAECAIEFVWRKKVQKYQRLIEQGWLCDQKGDLNRALRAYMQAVNLEPKKFEIYNNLNNLVARMGRLEQASLLWDKCIHAMPESYEAHYFRALFLISIGKYDEGFRLRDPMVPDRRRTPIAPPTDYPRWEGQSLIGKSIVIWTEFGFGDEIMFARFAKVFKGMGARSISIVCQEPLVRLFEYVDGVDKVISTDNVTLLESQDYWVFPHSIPVHYSMGQNGVPAGHPYITLNSDDKEERIEMPSKKIGRLRVGLVYRGNPTHENDKLRSIFTLDVMQDLFALPNLDWVVLQKDDTRQIEEDFKFTTHLSNISVSFVGHSFDDFLDGAKVCSKLDLIISVDTAIAHLGGAIGVPVLLMLPTFSDWRWGVLGISSEWYPKTTIFRQVHTGDWSNVITDIKNNLLERLRAMNFEIRSGFNI